MSDSSTIGAGESVQAAPADAPAGAAPGAPVGASPGAYPAMAPLVLSTQYVREMNFRVPGAPAIYAIQNIRPHITLGIDVQARQAEDNHPTYEVTLLMSCTATTHAPVPGQDPPPVAFVVDLAYSGIFILQNVPADAVEPVLLAECPRLLFPFARAVLADITREAGFPPVMLQPFDFIAFWQTKRAANAAAVASGGGDGEALERALQPAT